MPATDSAEPVGELILHELRSVLDGELSHLPEKYRAPLVLCYLQGKTNDEAARQLGWTKGTVSGRLARGRDMLRKRLIRRGVTLSTATLAAALAEEGSSAAVPAGLVASTVKLAKVFALGEAALTAAMSGAVASLVKGTLKTMFLAKMRVAALLLGACLLVTGTGVLSRQSFTEIQAIAQQSEPSHPPTSSPEMKTQGKQVHSDRYGDPLPPGALVRMGTVRLRPGSAGTSVGYFAAFLPGGKVLVSEGHRGIRFWDVATGKELRRIDAPGGGIWSFALSPDGKVLAACCFDKTIHLWEAATGKEIRKIKSDSGARVAYSHDGKTLVSSEYGALRFWNLATGKEDLRILNQHSTLGALAFTGDDKAVVTWDINQGMFYWDVTSGKKLRQWAPSNEQLRKFFSPAGGVTSLTISPDGKLLAAGCMDNTIRLVDVASATELRMIESRQARVTAFSPDNKILIATDEKETVLWDMAGEKQLRRIPGSGGACTTFSPDGKIMAFCGGGAISLWDVATGKELVHTPGHEHSVDYVGFSPSGKVLATRSFMDSSIRLWEAGSGREVRLLRTEDPGYPMAFTPDGTNLVYASGDGIIRYRDTSTGEEVGKIDVEPDSPARPKWQTTVNSLTLTPDGRRLATFSSKLGGIGPSAQRTALIQVWDLASRKQLSKSETAYTISSYYPVFSPDGSFLAFEEGRGIVIWNVTRNKKRLTLPIPDSYRVGRIVYSPDGKIVAAITYQNVQMGPYSGDWENYTLRTWELATGQEVLHVPMKDRQVSGLAFSPDGKVLAWGCTEAIRLFDVATGKELLLRRGHDVPVHCLAFSPDGKTLASGLADSTTLTWDVAPQTWHAGLPARSLGPQDLGRLWSNLAGADAAKAYQAVWTLVANPEKAVAFLKDHLPPTTPEDQRPVQQLIADLDSRQFSVREKASRQLEELAAEAEPALLRAIEEKPSVEAPRRIEKLLDAPQIVRSPESLCRLRAIRVLEQIGTKEAQRILESLAGGAPLALATRDAHAALERIRRRDGKN